MADWCPYIPPGITARARSRSSRSVACSVMVLLLRVSARRQLRLQMVRAVLIELGAGRRDKADVGGPQVRAGNPGRGDRHDVPHAHAEVARAADGQSAVKQACPIADELGTGRGELVRTLAVHYGDIKRTSD